jgi:two-component system, LuxR family, response regulator FixJ
MREPLAHRPLVAVVDDDPSVRQALTRLLGSADLEVRAFASGGELLGCDWPVLLICLVIDFHLPDMNGLVLLRRIAETRPHLRVVIISGETDPELRTQALRQGAAAFLSKPIDDTELLREVLCTLGC